MKMTHEEYEETISNIENKQEELNDVINYLSKQKIIEQPTAFEGYAKSTDLTYTINILKYNVATLEKEKLELQINYELYGG